MTKPKYAPIRDAGKAWAAERRRLLNADSSDMMDAVLRFDAAAHSLLVALDEPCECDDGTCSRDVDIPL